MNPAVLIGIAFLAGFLLALYGFLCLLSLQAYVLTLGGWIALEGTPAAFLGVFILGVGSLMFLQSLRHIERRYSRFARKGSIASILTAGIGAIGCLVLYFT